MQASKLSLLTGNLSESAPNTVKSLFASLAQAKRLTDLSVPTVKIFGLQPKYLPFPQPTSANRAP